MGYRGQLSEDVTEGLAVVRAVAPQFQVQLDRAALDPELLVCELVQTLQVRPVVQVHILIGHQKLQSCHIKSFEFIHSFWLF